MNGNRKLYSVTSRFSFVGLFVGVLLTAGFAVTHVVQFGGSLGFAYSPKSLSAKVGDTVEWEGSFSTHPLSSTTIPTQAASWHNASGATFMYIIKVPGTYNYQCDVHFSLGMVGTFTATSATEVLQPSSAAKQLDLQTIVLQSRNALVFSLPQAERVKVTLFTILGKEITTKVNGFVPAGHHEVVLGPLAKGFYFVKFTAGGVFSEIKELQIIQ